MGGILARASSHPKDFAISRAYQTFSETLLELP
jgi:hypothetical protein